MIMIPFLCLKDVTCLTKGEVIRVEYWICDGDIYNRVGVLSGHIVGYTFFVDDFFGPGKWGLGTRGVLSIIRCLKMDFPCIKRLSGPRLTGARMVHGIVDGSGHASLEQHF